MANLRHRRLDDGGIDELIAADTVTGLVFSAMLASGIEITCDRCNCYAYPEDLGAADEGED